jgi:drug/metabolite transporter (DMT)-like permease
MSAEKRVADSPSGAKSSARGVTSTDLLMLSVVLIWGINFSVLKVVLGTMTPLAFNGVRFSLATVAMVLILLWRRESFRMARRDIVPIILLGVVGHTLYQLFFITGIARTTAANAALLMATAPIFVVIYGAVLGVERANRWMWAGILLSFLGLILLIGGGGGVSLDTQTILGDLLVLAAAMLWAAYTTGSKPLLARYTPLKLTTLSMIAGAVPLVIICIPQMRAQDWDSVGPGVWAGVFYSAVFSVVLAYLAWYTSVQRVGSARTAIYSNLTPVVAIIVAWVVLGQTLAPVQIVGALIVLTGVMITRRGKITAMQRPKVAAPVEVEGSNASGSAV